MPSAFFSSETQIFDIYHIPNYCFIFFTGFLMTAKGSKELVSAGGSGLQLRGQLCLARAALLFRGRGWVGITFICKNTCQVCCKHECLRACWLS